MNKYKQRYANTLYYWLGLIFFILLIFQRMPFLSLKIGNAYPIVVFPAILLLSCFLGEWVGFWFGLFSGLLLDTLAGRSPVFNTVAFVVLAVGAGLVYHYVLNKNLPAVLLGNFGFCLVYYFAKWFFLYCIGPGGDSGGILFFYFLPSAIYTALWTIPFYYALKKLMNHYVIE